MQLALVTRPLQQIIPNPYGLLRTRSCSNCRSWEVLDDCGQSNPGLCRRFALAPTFDAWPITQAGDWCANWVEQDHSNGIATQSSARSHETETTVAE